MGYLEDKHPGSYMELRSEEDLHMRLEAQGESDLWDALAAIWNEEDDKDIVFITAVINFSDKVDYGEDDREELIVAFPEMEYMIMNGIYHLVDFYVFTKKRVYFSYAADPGGEYMRGRLVVCGPRFP